ncbi:ROK family transcriptional regulator [Novacetimonas maltaceti]|uniref:ROK family protein n=2 Tax=Novacetimonas maltaceti TaxID=1203393 RepID=A0A2S3W4Z9_9PROT|nr:ROK family transcriptional regulator [Novacetimonas maltaceti]POF63946.1 ROK family protein [Novacetimonas maltaceti]
MFTSGQYRVLRAISTMGNISRTQLVDITGLSKATVSTLTRELLDRNILSERELVFGQGRPAILLGLNAVSACFAGVSLQSDPGQILLTDLHGEILVQMDLPRICDPDLCVDQIATGIHDLLVQAGDRAGPLGGIGIAIPGFVARDRRVCLRSTALGWRNVDIVTPLKDRMKVPVFAENDANALVQGEHLFGILRDCPDFSMIIVGDGGIGCAHIVDGKLHRGFHGGAGEISHTTVFWPDGREPDRPCSCGKRGCLDTVSSLQAIRSMAQQRGLPGSPAELEMLARDGHADALGILHTAGGAMGLAVAQLVQLFDPSQVVVLLDEPFREGVFGAVMRQTMETNVMPRPDWETTLTLRETRHTDWATGAAGIATRQFLFSE